MSESGQDLIWITGVVLSSMANIHGVQAISSLRYLASWSELQRSQSQTCPTSHI